MLVNCIGESDGGSMLCTGGSAVWNAAGECVGRLPTDRAGVLFYDIRDGSTKAVLYEDGEDKAEQGSL